MISNLNNLPLSLAVFLAHKDYDGNIEDSNHRSISATSLLKSPKQIIMASRIPSDGLMVDVSSMISARLGHAYHDAVEQAWRSDKLNETLKELSVPKRIREKIVINPEQTNEGDIPIYLEQRTQKVFNNWIITGKFDFIFNGTLEDFKSTSVYTYKKQTNADKYILQGSIYRWLNPDKIKDDHMQINYIFTDWSANQAKGGGDYPPTRILAQKFPLLSLSKTEAYIREKLSLIEKYWDSPEEDIPPCNDQELWRSEPVWKYYSSREAQRATKVFNNPHEAGAYAIGKKGFVTEVKGDVRACLYCPAFTICEQKEKYLQTGELKI